MHYYQKLISFWMSISPLLKKQIFISPGTITINVIASDPYGTINEVEFYKRNVKLGEITSAPYSYAWKEVPEGTYSIIAAAPDNQNLKTVSSPIFVVVEISVIATNSEIFN